MSKKFLEDHPGCENVIYHHKVGEKDETILQKTDKEEYVIVTKDIEFALDALIVGFAVIYHDKKENNNFFQATQLPHSFITDFIDLGLKI